MATDHRINVRFFDSELNLIGEIDQYAGLEFVRRWTQYGTFTLFVYELTDIMQIGNYIMLDADPYKTGIIKRIQGGDTDDTYAQVEGFTLSYLLTQRITYPPVGKAYHSFNTAAEDIIRQLVISNMVDATDSKRNIPLLTVADSQGRGDVVSFQTRYGELWEEVQTLCQASGLGIAIRLDAENRRLVFEVFEGIDRSTQQSDRPPMVFNVEYDNVSDREYISDASEYKNTAITGGQGEGSSRVIYISGDSNTGLDRYEMFVDARDIEDESALPDRATSKLAEYTCTESYTSDVDTSQYGIKWDLGDIVVAIDKDYSVNMEERVVEVTESFDEKGYTVSPTFGTIVKTIIEKVQDATSPETVYENQGATGETGEQGEPGVGLQYSWSGTSLGVKREDEGSYSYVDLKGEQGETGATGPQGPQGETGATGPQGEKGDKGDKGDTGSVSVDDISALKSVLLDWIFPVGKTEIFSADVDPNTQYGGTWEKIESCFLLASGSSYALGSTGGEAEHTLTVDEMPSHNHSIREEFGASASANFPINNTYNMIAGDNAETKSWQSAPISSTGGGSAHNNMPPYTVVNVWKRTA